MERLINRILANGILRLHLLVGLFAARIDRLSRKAYCELILSLEGGLRPEEYAQLLERFPPRGRIATCYDNLMASYTYYALAKQLIPINRVLGMFLAIDSSKPQFCYIPGRFVMAPSLVGYSTVCFCLIHLGNRIYHGFAKPPIANLPLFLLQEGAQLNANYRNFLTRYDCNLENQSTGMQEFFRYIKCYQVKFGSYKMYRLRPNRSPETLNRLAKFYAFVTGAALLSSLTILLIIAAVIVAYIIMDLNYLRMYPGCDETIMRLHEEGKLSEWSITLTPRRFLVVLLDTIENMAIWFETDLIVLVIFPFVLLINYDLMIYWASVGRKVQRLEQRLSLEQLKTDLSPSEAKHLDLLRNLLTSGDHKIQIENAEQEEYWHSLDFEIRDLQSEIADFFKLKLHANPFVSDAITIWLVFWWVELIGVNYATIAEKNRGPLLNLFHLIPLYTLLMFSVLSLELFRLNKQILKSYTQICSIMALDKSRYKKQFITITSFYIERKFFAFTLFRQYPFVSATYVAMIGWVISGCILIQNLCRSYFKI